MKKTIILRSEQLGSGEEALGKTLMHSFLFTLSQGESLPDRILCYNTGVRLACESSDSLSELKLLEERGVEIACCGTCLQYFNLKDALCVGTITNMQVIADAWMHDDIVCP